MSAHKVVSLIGLPGSGKTTLGRALVTRLGAEWRYLGIGESLRERARTDSSLQAHLATGQLGPEDAVELVVREAAWRCQFDGGLVVDGFPRHLDQITLARRFFPHWLVLHLSLSTDTAAIRVANRSAHEDRPEDGEVAARLRIEFARKTTAALIAALDKNCVANVDAELPIQDVVRCALTAIIGSTTL